MFYSVLTKYKQRIMSLSLSVFLQKSANLILVILGVFLAYQLALFTWYFFPTQEPAQQWSPVIIKSKNNVSVINTHKLQQLHLFGQDLSANTQEGKNNLSEQRNILLSEAPRTKLHLVLVGVVAASTPSYSSAIISYKGEQDSYFIDSKIEGTRASISGIYKDRVILSVDGELQSLMLDLTDKKESKKTSNKAFKGEEVKLDIDRQDLLENPDKLTDYIRISPYRKDGKVLGYRLKAGKDKTLFEQAGFKKNDLAIELNGVDLTDKSQALSLMKEFSSMTDISVTVDRDGQLYELSLSL